MGTGMEVWDRDQNGERVHLARFCGTPYLYSEMPHICPLGISPASNRSNSPYPYRLTVPHTGQSTSPARQCDYALCACAHGWVPPAAMRPLHGCAVLLMCHRTAPHLACRCPLGTPLIFIPSSRSLVGFCCQHLVWEACLCRSHTIFWCCRAASCLPQPVTLWAVASGWCWPAAGCCLLTAGLLLVACAATPSQPEQSSA